MLTEMEDMVAAVTSAADSVLEKYRRAKPAELAKGDVLDWIIGDSRWHTIDSTTPDAVAIGYRQYTFTWFERGVKINFSVSLNEKTASLLPFTIEHVQTGGLKKAIMVDGKVTILSMHGLQPDNDLGNAIVLLVRNIKWVLHGRE